MALEDDIVLLSNVPILCHLEKDALRLLAFASENVDLDVGERLFSQGDHSDGGYVVRKGEITLHSDNHKETIIASPQSLIGRTALFVRIERPSTAIARIDSNLLRISSNLMKRCLREYPYGASVIYNIIAQELQELTQDMTRIQNSFL